MRRRLYMLLVVLALYGGKAYSQAAGGDGQTAAQTSKIDKKVKRLDKQLSLTPEQKQQVQVLFQQQAAALKSATEQLRTAKQQRMKTRMDFQIRLNALLSPAQAEKLNTLIEKWVSEKLARRADQISIIMKDKAGLSEQQQADVRKLMETHLNKVRNIRKANINASAEELKTQLKEARKELKAQLKTVLSKEQLKKWKDYRKNGRMQPAR